MFLLASCKTTKHNTNNILSYVDAIEHHRNEYKNDFIKTAQTPLKESDLEYLDFFKANEAYNCDCKFELTEDSKPFQMGTYSGKFKPFIKYGIATCIINENEIHVNVYSSLNTIALPGYEDYLFIPFKDYTSGEQTYGGGRYIDIVIGDIKNNKVNIDFNKCYNPWCAYSDGYNCPIPPKDNYFEINILAGEKMWKGEKKH